MEFRSPQSVPSGKLTSRAQSDRGESKFFQPCDNTEGNVLLTSDSEREGSSSQKETRTKTKARRRNNARYTKKDFEKTEKSHNDMEIEQERNKKKKNLSESDEERVPNKKTKDCLSLNEEPKETKETSGKPIVKSFKTILVNKEIIEVEDLDETNDPVEDNVSYMNANSRLAACSTDTESKLNISEIKDQNKGDSTEEGSKQNEPTVETEKRINSQAETIRNNAQKINEINFKVDESENNTNRNQGNKSIDVDYTIFAKGKNTNITKQNRIKIQAELNGVVGRRIQVNKSGDSLRIGCVNEAERRKIKSKATIADFEVTYSDPYKKDKNEERIKKGIIFQVDPDFSEEEVCEEIGAKSVKRIIKKIGGKEIKTAQMLVIFEQELPKQVMIGWRRHRVEIFIPDPIRCYQCQRYGHKASACNGYEKCSICSNRHNVKECPEKTKGMEERNRNAQTAEENTLPLIGVVPISKLQKKSQRFNFLQKPKCPMPML